MIKPPEEGAPTQELWRTVAELVKEHNALMSMTLESGSLGIQGKLETDGERSVMKVTYNAG